MLNFKLLNIFKNHEDSKLKLRIPEWEPLKVSRRGTKLVEYCKTCKTYIADCEIIKRRAEVQRVTLRVAALKVSEYLV